MAAMSLEQFFETYRDTIHRLYLASDAATWNVSESSFATALWRSVERRFSVDQASFSRDNVIHFLDSLHIRDVALAVGCLLGNPDAWHRFATDRPFLKRHGVTRRELRAFKELSLLGYVLSRHQFLAILMMIREPEDG